MSLLHDYFNTRNLQAFQRLLDGCTERGQHGTGGSSSAPAGSSFTGGGGGKSWNRSHITYNSQNALCDVNGRDWLGRTPLHLACTSLESIEYIRSLLKHPQIDVNLPDTESLWTPLHRALYSANFPAALLLLQRSDVDSNLKDLEGYTAFDLYNSTVNGTKPDREEVMAELFTWGANRNAALGMGDADDRTYPDHVHIKSKEDSAVLAEMDLCIRFSPIHVRQIRMSKLHTAIVTTEREGNLRLCGFGSGGRLGPAQHTQYCPKPLPSFNLLVTHVALGQDHTLALTSSGEVYSWGLNRFSQLGYIVEVNNTAMSRHEEPIQSIPKRVVGLLRKEIVRGVAASKNASACWTNETIFTWGTNNGQLGYDKNAQPIQVLPRPVTKFTNTVIDVAMSDTVLAALLVTRHVECLSNDRHYRINFPMHAFPTGIQPYRPPQSVKDAHIAKITCCNETFAALSSNGEVFTFSASMASNAEPSSVDSRGVGPIFKPQRVWALRKKFSAVKDVALGSDGSIIICTESGHVYVRTRNGKSSSGKAFKFERIPFLQRVLQVCANSTGAFGALKVNHEPKPIEVNGDTISQSLKVVQPYIKFYCGAQEDDVSGEGSKLPGSQGRKRTIEFSSADDEPEDASIEEDIKSALDLFGVLAGEQRMRKAGGGSVNYDGIRFPYDADTMVHVQSGAAFPVHRVILAARSRALENLLLGSKPLVDVHSKLSMRLMPARPGPGLGVTKLMRFSITGCHPLSVLIIFRYLYSDELLALWDRRVGSAVEKQIAKFDANPPQIKADLRAFARLLDLPALTLALDPPVKREPAATMVHDLQRLFDVVQSPLPKSSPLAADVVLQLADNVVYTHSVLLRARTPLFTSFFDLEDWTMKRWEADGMIKVNLKHLRWHSMRFVLRFMCYGADKEMFQIIDFVDSVEQLLQLMFEITAGANELLLDRLVLICASVILAYSNTFNACYVLADATHYHVQPLIEKLQEYISINMETFLEGRMLDDMPYTLVKQLAKFVRMRQIEKSPFSRSDTFVNGLLKKHITWLELQDFPQTITRTMKGLSRKEASTAKLSPPTPVKNLLYKVSLTASQKAPSSLTALDRRVPSGDDVFIMDEPDSTTSLMWELEPPPSRSPPAYQPVWKAQEVPKVDMKALMAEAASKSQLTGSVRQSFSEHVPQPAWSNVNTRTSSHMPEMTPKKSGVPMTWRTNVDHGTHDTPPATPPSLSSMTSNALKEGARTSVVSSITKTRPTQGPSTPVRTPGLGPVITPSRQAVTKSGPGSSHKTNMIGEKAWTNPPVQSISKSPPATGMSFIAIQHSQKERIAPVKDKRSLREIQEEEQSLQAEADFLKWWTAEEERVQQETMALAQFERDCNKPPQPRKTRNFKAKRKANDKAEVVDTSPPPSGSLQQPQSSQLEKRGGYHSKKSSRKQTQKGTATGP